MTKIENSVNQGAKAGSRWKRSLRHGIGYFQAALDPKLEARARVKAAAKGIGVVAGLAATLFLLYAILLIPFTPSIDDLLKAKTDQPSILMSADGKRLAALKPMNREWVRLNQISPHVINA